jgi:putative Holliday junction resolvase
MTFLAIDYGAQRLGLAISDDAGRLAVPLQTLSRRQNDMNGDLEALLNLIRARGIGAIVMGIPSGSEQSDATAAKARRFVTRLDAEAQKIGVELAFFETDERFSSAQAHNQLRDEGISTRQSRQSSGANAIDARSAAVFLQTFLDSRRGVQDAPVTHGDEAEDDEKRIDNEERVLPPLASERDLFS